MKANVSEASEALYSAESVRFTAVLRFIPQRQHKENHGHIPVPAHGGTYFASRVIHSNYDLKTGKTIESYRYCALQNLVCNKRIVMQIQLFLLGLTSCHKEQGPCMNPVPNIGLFLSDIRVLTKLSCCTL